MQLPGFDGTEFNFLANDLKGPLDYHKYLEIKKQIKFLQRQIDGLNDKGPIGKRLLSSIEEEILKIIDSAPKKSERKKFLEQWAEKFKQAKVIERKYNRSVALDSLRTSVWQILQLYLSFNISEFKSDFVEVFPEEIDKDHINAQIDEIEESIKALLKSNPFRRSQAATKKYFKRDPKTFRGMQNKKGFVNSNFFDSILECFLDTWKQRAPLFREPVTISGISIRSLPDESKEIWMHAYDTIDLGSLKKSIQFIPIEYTRENKEEPVDVPEFFQKDVAKT